MTFVVLAIGRGTWAFFADRISPVEASISRAAAAVGFGSADAEEGKMPMPETSNSRAGSRSPICAIGPLSQDTLEISTATVPNTTLIRRCVCTATLDAGDYATPPA